MVGDGHVRVVREGEVDVERALAYGVRRAARSWEMPSTRVTKTTGETGRKVPVPRRCTRNGSEPGRDLGEVLLDLARGRRSSISVGGTSVMCVGIIVGRGVADGGPVVLELGRPGLRDGQGDSDRGHAVDPTGSRGDEADPLVDVAQRRLGDRAGLLGALLEHGGQVRLVVEQLEGALAERGDEVDDDLGEVLLQVAVAAAGVLLLERRRSRSPVSAE